MSAECSQHLPRAVPGHACRLDEAARVLEVRGPSREAALLHPGRHSRLPGRAWGRLQGAAMPRGAWCSNPRPPSILHWARTPHTHHYPTHNAAGVSSSATSDSESQAQRPGGPLPLSLLPGVAPGGRGSLACPPAPSQPEGGHACGKGLSKQATRARTIQRVRPSPQCDGHSGPYPEHSGRGQHWVWRNWPAFALGRPGSSHSGPPTLGQRLLWGPQPGPWP